MSSSRENCIVCQILDKFLMHVYLNILGTNGKGPKDVPWQGQRQKDSEDIQQSNTDFSCGTTWIALKLNIKHFYK
jgi:hypothetical protein